MFRRLFDRPSRSRWVALLPALVLVASAAIPAGADEAIRLYTEGAAWFSFDDHHVGSMTQGKYADLVVLSEDYLTVPEQRIRKIDSVLTFVGGRVVHAVGPFAGMLKA